MNNWFIQEASLLITGNVYADIIIVLSILLLIDLVIQEIF
jgi:hypothetical protein